MLETFTNIKHFLLKSPTSIDNTTFRLHYKATVFVLVACSILLIQKQYFGDPIDCVEHKGDVKQATLDTYCWITGAYTVPSLLDKKVGKHVTHPGVGFAKLDDRRYHDYYQWVVLFVSLQALLFYVPRYLWKMFEGGKVKMLVENLNTPIVDDDLKKSRLEMMVTYFTVNLHDHNNYAIKYIVCEVLNFINVIGQIYFTDMFLGFEFLKYGTDVLAFTEQDIGTRHDPMDRVFPKVTACTFSQYGRTGDHEHHNAMCVLPLNILNEKIFIFLWFWYVIVATLTAIGLLYRAATFFPGVRMMMMKARARLTPAVAVEQVTNRCYYGDWFILSHLAKNMDPLIFKDFMMELGKKFKGIDD